MFLRELAMPAIAPWEMLLNHAGAGDGIRHSLGLWLHRMFIQFRVISAPFSLGSDQERGQRVTVFPKEQTEEVGRGERLNTGVNKVKGIFWEEEQVSREVGEKVGGGEGLGMPVPELRENRLTVPPSPPNFRLYLCSLVVVIPSAPCLLLLHGLTWPQCHSITHRMFTEMPAKLS